LARGVTLVIYTLQKYDIYFKMLSIFFEEKIITCYPCIARVNTLVKYKKCHIIIEFDTSSKLTLKWNNGIKNQKKLKHVDLKVEF